MILSAISLLKSLASGVRPAGVESSPTQGQPLEARRFDDLLQQAQAGDIESGLPVIVGRNAGVTLSDSQLQRLAQAADRAEAEGASRAVVLIDGMVLTMDVAIRTITGKADLTETGVMNGVDAVITVAPPEQAATRTAAGPVANAALMQNRSLMEVLASREGAEPA